MCQNTGCDTTCKCPDVPQVDRITTITKIIKGSNYINLEATVDGGLGSPIQGQTTWQSNSLIGSQNINSILVNKNNETVADGDFSVDSTTGTLTRSVQFFANDKIIFPLFKKV